MVNACEKLRQFMNLCHTGVTNQGEANIMTKLTASQKRAAAMSDVCTSVVGADGNGDTVWHTENRVWIAERIRTLLPLGRTDRWQGRVEGWAQMVEEEGNPLDWAFLQGAVYVNFEI